MLVVGQVIMRLVTAAGGELYLYEGALAAGFLAGLEEGGVVLLAGVVVASLSGP